MKTEDIRLKAKRLTKRIQLTVTMCIYDHQNRQHLTPTDYHIEHIIDLKFFVSATEKCAVKPDTNVIRRVANNASNVVKVSGWVDSLKDFERQHKLFSPVWLYLVIMAEHIRQTLLLVKKDLGVTFLQALIQELSNAIGLRLVLAEDALEYHLTNNSVEYGRLYAIQEALFSVITFEGPRLMQNGAVVPQQVVIGTSNQSCCADWFDVYIQDNANIVKIADYLNKSVNLLSQVEHYTDAQEVITLQRARNIIEHITIAIPE